MPYALFFMGLVSGPKEYTQHMLRILKNKPSNRYKVAKGGAILYAATVVIQLDRKPVRSIPGLKSKGDC